MPKQHRIQFNEDKYKAGEEIHRTSKLYTISCIPDKGNLKVLDVGCGTGLNSSLIAKQGHQMYGVDISSNAIAKYNNRGMTGLVCDLERFLPFRAHTFDLVFFSEVVEHLVSPQDVLKEIHRILKPGGKLVLSTPNSAFWVYRILGLLGYTLTEIQHKMHLRFFSKRSLIQLVQQSGFQVNHIIGRNMYMVLPILKPRCLNQVLLSLGFKEEVRFRTSKKFLQLSRRSKRMNSFFSDTFIVNAGKREN